ncbi:uncharacterized protein cubi_01938 [Cryptosporidium ubiquitum]|uniref:Mediator of RNA polymerase II transcription subunit 6 n=1 Tax=Cryptosporidium ubiquitum TaxID=857276 RepID=A0A1J4MME5_9CRYT|nr:uncharacterized protein cubi_01938 [Cryptosporidium ubiquitum]OII75417.1 hypothetical protein cubi_01938 [Cryptosporidium ubiquitum]
MTDILGVPLCSFRDDLWLGRFTLTPENALEYFYLSPFHDPNSLNIQRKLGKHTDAAEGFEYRITYINEEGLGNVPQPPGSTWNTPNQFGIFIIQKFYIEFQREVPLNIYYILSGTIYEAPTLSNVFLHRTAEAFLSMEKAFDALNEMARFSLYEGYTWDNLEATSKINSDMGNVDSNDINSNEENLVEIIYSSSRNSKIDNILMSAKKELIEKITDFEKSKS